MGATENAGKGKCGTKKMQWWKMREIDNAAQNFGVDNAGKECCLVGWGLTVLSTQTGKAGWEGQVPRYRNADTIRSHLSVKKRLCH